MADDVFIRYQCFRDAAEMSKAIQNKLPHKIDIGPLMNVKPSLHAAVKKMEYLERELIFDVDMDAYDDIRTCEWPT
jgi:DNA primase small subunit